MTHPPLKLSKKSSVLVPWPVPKDLYIYEIENPNFILIESGSIIFVRIYTFLSKNALIIFGTKSNHVFFFQCCNIIVKTQAFLLMYVLDQSFKNTSKTTLAPKISLVPLSW